MPLPQGCGKDLRQKHRAVREGFQIGRPMKESRIALHKKAPDFIILLHSILFYITVPADGRFEVIL